MKFLSVCSYGQVRSVVCQKIIGGKLLPGGISDSSEQKLKKLSQWADKIIVMTEIHYWYYKKFFPEFLSKIITLGINDIYGGFVESEILRKLIIKALERYQIPIRNQPL